MSAHRDAQEGRGGAAGTGVASVPTVDAAAVLTSHTLRRATDSPIWDVDRCAECIRPWRGDAATGGCTVVLLAKEVVALRERAEADPSHDRCRKDMGYLAKKIRVLRDEIGRRDARVALLEGLLGKMLSAFMDGEQWWRSHSGCCAEGACPDNHRCCALYAEVLAVLADGEAR